MLPTPTIPNDDTLIRYAALSLRLLWEDEKRADHEGGFGHHGVEEFGVVHSEPPFSAACMRGDCRAGVIQSRRTSGLRPM